MKVYASISGGKDSLAALITHMERGGQCDGAIYCRIMFDDETSAEVPEHEEWLHSKCFPLLEREYGIKTQIVQGKYTYTDCFYKQYEKGGKVGKIWGFPSSQKSLLSASRTIKEVAQMKKLYSKKLGGEAFALDAAQLDTLKKAGYTVPSPEEVIADAAAVKIEPPEGKRAYVVFDFKTGAFKVRTRTQTLAESEVGGFVGEVVSAAILCGFVERADMDNPKADAPATPTTASPLVNMLRDAFLRAANNKTAPAADKPAEAADAPEVVE